MKPTIQSGMHPDAESLTALAEQLLPAVQRDQILVHMATCTRCREVVFLAQRAMETEQPETVSVLASVPAKQRVSWFGVWRWAWIPVAALAAFVGAAVLQHFRHPAESTQLAVNTPKADTLHNAEPTKTAPTTSAASLKSEEPQPSKPLAKRDGLVGQAAKDAAKQLDEKKSVVPKESEVVFGGAPVVLPQGVSGGSIHGVMTARAKASPIGGPAATNQFQQQNLAPQNLTLQNSVLQAQNVPVDAKHKLVLPSAALGPASETVTVQADKAEPLPTPASASPTQISSLPLTGKSDGVLSAATVRQNKMQKITLPSGLGVLSVASDAGRSVALDTAGAIFWSEDGGKLWQPIQAQWTGHAALVRTLPASPPFNALKRMPAPSFELVNDKLQTWFSYDGKIWTAQSPPLN
jgi:hypothetical protein